MGGSKKCPHTEVLPLSEVRISYPPLLFLANTPGHCLTWGYPQIIVFVLLFLLSQISDFNFFSEREGVEGLSDEILEHISVMINEGSGDGGLGFKSRLCYLLS